MRFYTFILLSLLPYLTKGQAQGTPGALSVGSVLKISTSQEGLYRIDANSLLTYASLPIDLSKTALFGHYGGNLPQPNATDRPLGLVNLPVKVIGDGDNLLEANESILFYSQGVDIIKFNNSANAFYHEKDVYSLSQNFYLVVNGVSAANLIQEQNLESSNEPVSAAEFYQVVEPDERHVMREDREVGAFANSFGTFALSASSSGREWFSNPLPTSDRAFTIQLPGPALSNEIELSAEFYNNSVHTGGLNGSINGTSLFEDVLELPGVFRVDRKGYGDMLRRVYFDSVYTLSGTTLDLKLRRQNVDGEVGQLGISKFSVKASVIPSTSSASQFIYNYPSSESSIVLPASSNSRLHIWNIVDPYSATSIKPGSANTLLSGPARLLFAPEAALRSVDNIERTENQDLTSNLTEAVDYLIITPKEYLVAGQELADYRKETDNWSTRVVAVEEVLTEFAAGRNDVVGIRDYIRQVYLKGGSLKYVFIIGDANYDFREIKDKQANTVPSYQSRQSTNNVTSFASDDFYGILEDQEGEFSETNPVYSSLDVAIGRLPARTIDQVYDYLDKVMVYESAESFGSWRLRAGFVADNQDNPNENNIFIEHSEIVGGSFEQKVPGVVREKYYLDGYRIGPSENPFRKVGSPMFEEMQREIESGLLWLNFIGHGNEGTWTEERTLLIRDIENWRNKGRPMLMVTATCEFGRFDDPVQVSGAEAAVLRANGGSIASLSTTRAVYASSNLKINSAFSNALATTGSSGGRLGDVFRATKNDPGAFDGVRNRNFTLMGDPGLKLAIPQAEVAIEELRTDFRGTTDTLSAMDRVTFKGKILDSSGTHDPNFDGILQYTLFDKPSSRSTFQQNGENQSLTYSLQDNYLVRGKATVTSGSFELSIQLPKDINYQFGEGELQLYASSKKSNYDASGVHLLKIGGSAPQDLVTDTSPPEVQVWMEDERWSPQDVVATNTAIFLRLKDDFGINISSTGLSGGITATLDPGPNAVVYSLNDYYESDLDEFASGEVYFPLYDLEPGIHTLQVVVSDVFNNRSTRTIEFTVGGKQDVLDILSTEISPNPATTTTELMVTHNKVGRSITGEFRILNSQGQLVYSVPFLEKSAGYRIRKQIDTSSLQSGIYLIQTTLNSNGVTITGSVERLVVL